MMKSYNWITQTRLEGGRRRQSLQRIFGMQNSTELWKFYPFERWILDYPHYNEVPNLGPVNKLWFFGPLLKIPILKDLHSCVKENAPAIKEVHTVSAQIERHSRLERQEPLFRYTMVNFDEKWSKNTVIFVQHLVQNYQCVQPKCSRF